MQEAGKRRRGRPRRGRPRKPRRTPIAQRGPPPPQPKVGNLVVIIIKPYKNNVTVQGIVKRVLTRRKFHSRGHKVELRDGTIGRIVKLIK
ncbi:uncharacterized protein METZ01_LOCUS64079 [marine metagenome]|uniref:Uncharacterized protein n=1 Tax=marine metagenome TaxID=408172 RepID=A0A381T4X6_9ZZZZ|tara:strand:- start:1393 stop:1662 length:270 start_codon:yes stop_codon:yes gene_type:complete